jgi:quercetin dioxygenase-like cupin family protein
MKAFPDSARGIFANAYPETPARLTHGLVDHPLLALPALVELAASLADKDVEYNPGTLPIGIAPEDIPSPRLGIVETIRSIEENGSWMVLKLVEQHPAYGELLESALAELKPFVTPKTGEMLTLQGFIFISSPDAVTPFHFDPEHNILLQIRGEKTMTVFPATDEEIVSPMAHEGFHLGQHHRNLVWDDAFAAKATSFLLKPGEAVHMPVKSPHWVKNGPQVSISLSVTWRSTWSYEEADARAFNHLLRKFGVSPASPKRLPRHNRAKSVAYRALRRLGLTG